MFVTAAPSANRVAFDQVRSVLQCLPLFLQILIFLSQLRAQANHAKEQASHSKARVKKINTKRKLEHQHFDEEILRFREDFENLKTHYESEIQDLKEQHQIQIDMNDANEGQMAEHILQIETERQRMHAEIISLV